MRIDELDADEFMSAMASLGEAIEGLAKSDLAETFKDDVKAFRAGDRSNAEGWAVDMLARYIPALLKGNVGDLYAVLAACDGQTVEEYKACFTPKKLMADVAALKAALGEGGALKELVAPFFG